jgi:threonine aldolase
MQRTIDLRSDTVTQPTPAMREAMARAEVGDDVYGEDPSVLALEHEVAQRLGKAAGLFTPSGTMANQIGLWLHARPGEEVLVSHGAHLMIYETGAGPALSGLQLTAIGAGWLFSAADVEAAFTPDGDHNPVTRVVAFENTHNRGGGRIFPHAQLLATAAAARRLGLALHLDGARLWNAHVATGMTMAEHAAPFDTVSVCLSKGLGAPVGSVLCGPEPLVRRARRRRKMLGGGMRQAGILAAAGRYALAHHVARLAEDHAHARLFADGLAKAPGVVVDPRSVETNLCIFDLAPDAPIDAVGFVERAKAKGLLLNSLSARRLRAVTHLDVDRAACARAAEIAVEILRSA